MKVRMFIIKGNRPSLPNNKVLKFEQSEFSSKKQNVVYQSPQLAQLISFMQLTAYILKIHEVHVK